MIIIRLMGGLGNQMQQYALYRKFISLGKEACLDTSWFENEAAHTDTPRRLEIDRFVRADFKTADEETVQAIMNPGIISRIMTKLNLQASRYVRENSMYQPEIFDKDDCLLEGYWSADRYYADIFPDLREKFDFAPLLDADPAKKARIDEVKSLIDETPFSCSVHIRRGDYLKPGISDLFGGVSTDEYYDSAFEYIRDEHPDVSFFIFSDDPDYVAAKYGKAPDCTAVDVNHGPDSLFDIYLMSLCDAHICANSSFSFWGARLDPHREEALCIRPAIHMRSQVFDEDLMHDLWKKWILIDPEGKFR